MKKKLEKTITDRTVDPDVLAYTVGDDPVRQVALLKAWLSAAKCRKSAE